MDSGRLFYENEYDALNAAVANSGRELKTIAQALWPGMKANSAYAKITACLNPLGDQQFKFHEYIALMRFCGQYDPLFYICDETLHARPPRIAPEDEEVKLVEALTTSAETVNRAVAALERLLNRERRPPTRAT